MKQVTIKQFISMLLIICVTSSCQKETGVKPDLSGTDKAMLTGKIAETPATGEKSSSNCAACIAGAKSYDLVEKQEATKLKEGDNVISILDDGVKAIARVKTGIITQWLLQDKTGKQYLPQSTELARIHTGPGNIPIYQICFILDGQWFCMLVLGFPR